MPLYEYECESCGIRFERRQHMEDEPIEVCPECGGHVHRLIQPVGIIFKGSGFYVTDNRAKSPTATPGNVKESSHSSDNGSKTSETSDSGSDTSSST
jgi:putative FmdB family regulatory protein